LVISTDESDYNAVSLRGTQSRRRYCSGKKKKKKKEKRKKKEVPKNKEREEKEVTVETAK
jgi:hypothetical protein